jgi:hypothetical protein
MIISTFIYSPPFLPLLLTNQGQKLQPFKPLSSFSLLPLDLYRRYKFSEQKQEIEKG